MQTNNNFLDAVRTAASQQEEMILNNYCDKEEPVVFSYLKYNPLATPYSLDEALYWNNVEIQSAYAAAAHRGWEESSYMRTKLSEVRETLLSDLRVGDLKGVRKNARTIEVCLQQEMDIQEVEVLNRILSVVNML